MEEKVKILSKIRQLLVPVPTTVCLIQVYWNLINLFQVTPNNVDIAKVAPTYHLYTPAEVEAVISRLWAWEENHIMNNLG